jgi:hypothetical protein
MSTIEGKSVFGIHPAAGAPTADAGRTPPGWQAASPPQGGSCWESAWRLIAAGVFGYWFFFMRGIVFTDDARFAGHLVDLAPEISGTDR